MAILDDLAEIARVTDNDAIDQATHEEVINVTKDLVSMVDEATGIVDFFKKQDEIRRMKKNIKRRIVASSFDDPEIRTVVMDRFMELAKVKFKA